MVAKYSSPSFLPFIFSNVNRYCIVAFFGLAIVEALVDSGAGRNFPLDYNPIIDWAFFLALVYLFWSGIDTIVWIIGKPDKLLEIAKRQSRKKVGSYLKVRVRFGSITYTRFLGCFSVS